jgi:mono/diheme cytochrome c family protein
MMKLTAASTGTLAAVVLFGLGISAQTNPPSKTPAAAQSSSPKPAMAVAHKTATQPPAAPAAAPTPDLTKQYCVGCHSDKGKAGGLSLVSFDPAHADQNAEVSEKIIRKLRLGMMPPPGMRRPDEAVLSQFATSLENKVDVAAAIRPNPGRRPFQRLNRAEYAHSVHDLLALDVDVNAFLPPDTLSAGYDNIADVQTFSATLMEGYLRAASRISTLVGDRTSPSEFTVKIAHRTQMRHVDSTPGHARRRAHPRSRPTATTAFRVMLHSTPTGQLFGSVASRARSTCRSTASVALLDVDWKMTETDKNVSIVTPRYVKAGPQHIAAAFIQKFDGVVDDCLADRYTLADTDPVTTRHHGPRTCAISASPVTRPACPIRRAGAGLHLPTSPATKVPCARKILSGWQAKLPARRARRHRIADGVLRGAKA